MLSKLQQKFPNTKLFKMMAFFEGLYFLAPIFVLYLTGHHITLAIVVFSQALYSMGVFVGEIPTGIFGDRYGQKLSVIIGYSLEVLTLLFIFLFPTTILFLALSFVRGVGGSFISGSDDAILYESTKIETSPDEAEALYTKTTGVISSNTEIGFVVSTALAGLFYEWLGTGAFSVLIIATLVSRIITILFVAFLKDHSTELKNDSEYKKVHDTSITGSSMLATLGQALKLIKKEKTILLFFVVAIVTVSGEYFLQSVYQPFFFVNHVSALWIGLVLTYGALLRALMSRFMYVFEEKLNTQNFVALAVGLLGLLYILLAVSTSSVMLVTVYIVMTGLFNLHKPIISRTVNSKTPTHIRATVLSGISFSSRAFQTLFYWILGFVVLGFGASAAITVWGVYLLVGAVITYVVLGKVSKRAVEDSITN